ncbi:C40 family peptidase [Streptomyces sp. DSM 44915]|uniref:C40 family peptidase n=1 Tax=Streptomyces chisholmiae TaxID=3075540 RepID=A0ABU2JJT0_9ACTN|nr:C40 family peptidase [Streptomyces sp. DSM 44915]MDT0265235.1 C40 family peptidase [Streptomyces sp. DSM 44915]
MAEHRRRRWRRTTYRKPWLSGRRSSLRVAAGLTLAGAATAGALDTPALADPEPTLAEVEERVDALHHEAAQATEAFNAATETAEEAEAELAELSDRAARRTAELNDARNALGAHASASYRAGGMPAGLALALSSDPDEFLRRADVLNRTGDRQSQRVREIGDKLRELEQLRDEADERAEEYAEATEEADRQRLVVEERLAEAEELLATRTEEERARVLAEESDEVAPVRAARDEPRAAEAAETAPAPTARAATAVGFATAQLGKPYGWGATGPDAFDCSGLTQAAWGAAGVSLPRTSYAQAGAGVRVSRSELAPGDLVFYYADNSHVALYIGNGQIVHAARSGTPVRLADVDSMPFNGATRPA